MKKFMQAVEIRTFTQIEEGEVPFFGRFGYAGNSQQMKIES